MKQVSLAETTFEPKRDKKTRKVKFLESMESVVPWSRLQALIEPHYPKQGNGRRPMPLDTMLRIHFMQQWFGYSDPAMEEALYDVPVLRKFAKLDLFDDVMPDETTILRFRHIIEKHELAQAIFSEVTALLEEKGLIMKKGTIVDATLIAAPTSTKNKEKQRDPEMSSTKKGNQWHFGIKAHIGVDAQSGLIHTALCTTGKEADVTHMESCTHGEEAVVLGDRGYHKNNRTIDELAKEGDHYVVVPSKKPKGGELTPVQKAFGRMISSIRAVVEHPFRVIKCQFGYRKVRYRGIKKNSDQLITLFALANLWAARKKLMPAVV
jgi:transposase, IS5 family